MTKTKKQLPQGVLCGYEDACGERERLECPYSVCDGCPLKPKEVKDDGNDQD